MELIIKKTTLQALINMLDDPDDQVFAVVGNKLVSIGKPAIQPLECALENCCDEQVAERIRFTIDRIHQQAIRDELSEWADNQADNLLKGYIILSRTARRDLDEVELLALVSQLKTEVWLELNDDLTALENIKVINHILFKTNRFIPDKEDIFNPGNTLLHGLLQTRTGNPVSLGMIYLIIARQLGLPVYGVNLPNHFILAYMAGTEVIEPTPSDVLFYINPYNNGAVFTRHEIDHFIGQLRIKPEPGFYLPCSNISLIRRVINHLIQSYRNRGLEKHTAELENLLTDLR